MIRMPIIIKELIFVWNIFVDPVNKIKTPKDPVKGHGL